MPVTADGAVLRPATVVWCTGSRPELSWLDVDGAVDADGEPVHERGIGVPGIGYVGLEFQYSAASATIQGMAQDARYVVRRLLAAR
jgi:putative flavoprotein involved in K+ transport